jgi:hypothetical protein
MVEDRGMVVVKGEKREREKDRDRKEEKLY